MADGERALHAELERRRAATSDRASVVSRYATQSAADTHGSGTGCHSCGMSRMTSVQSYSTLPGGKRVAVREVGRDDPLDVQRLDRARPGRELHAVQPRARRWSASSRRAPAAEEARRLVQRREVRRARQPVARPRPQPDVAAAVLGLQLQVDAGQRIADPEAGRALLAGEQAPADQVVQQRAGVPPRDVDPLARLARGLGPGDGDPVRGVLAGDARAPTGKPFGRSCSRRIRQMPAIAQLADELRRNGAGAGAG